MAKANSDLANEANQYYVFIKTEMTRYMSVKFKFAFLLFFPLLRSFYILLVHPSLNFILRIIYHRNLVSRLSLTSLLVWYQLKD